MDANITWKCYMVITPELRRVYGSNMFYSFFDPKKWVFRLYLFIFFKFYKKKNCIGISISLALRKNKKKLKNNFLTYQNFHVFSWASKFFFFFFYNFTKKKVFLESVSR
jgi:hypothetical protein